MTDFTTMSYNKIRDLAKAQGFEGANPKRADLVAFLEALEATDCLAETIDAAAEALADAEPVTTEEIIAAMATVEAAAKAQVEKEEAKAEKTEKKSDKIAARRAAAAEVVKEIFEENAIAMNWGAVVQKYEAKLGVKHDRVIWHDIGHAIRDLCDEGTVKVHSPDKGRTTYQRASL